VALVPEALACLAGPRLKLRVLASPPAPFVVGVARPTGEISKAAEHFIAAACACKKAGTTAREGEAPSLTRISNRREKTRS
jgi:hypothetical protein